jgi:hypothetical protein
MRKPSLVEDHDTAARKAAMRAWRSLRQDKARAEVWLRTLELQEQLLFPVVKHMACGGKAPSEAA